MYILIDNCHKGQEREIINVIFERMGVKYADVRTELDRTDIEECGIDELVGIVLTKEMLLSGYDLFYLERLRLLREKRKVNIVVALVNMKLEELPLRVRWLQHMDYLSVERDNDMLLFCYQCVKVMLDYVMKGCKCIGFHKIRHNKVYMRDYYLQEIIGDYGDMDYEKYEARMTYMKAAYSYVKQNLYYKQKKSRGLNYDRIVQYIFRYSGTNMPHVPQEAEIMEYCFLLAIHEHALYNEE